MSKKANPTLIGAFVLGAAVLTIAGVLLFGSGRFLSPSTTYVIYFSGSVTGLNIGAPVNFRGVNIGKVTGVEVEFDVRNTGIRTPVYVEIERDKFKTIGGTVEERDVDRILDEFVSRGLRAQLLAESLVTGLKAVELDFFPATPIHLQGGESEFRELPTVPSDFEQLTAEIRGLPIAELAASSREVMEGLALLIRSPELQDIPGQAGEALADLRSLLANVDTEVRRLADSLNAASTNTSETAAETMREVRVLVSDAKDPLLSLMADLESTSRSLRTAMGQTERTMKSVEATLRGTTDMQYELTITLREVGAAARSLRQLAESLEQSPESLLRGRGGPRSR